MPRHPCRAGKGGGVVRGAPGRAYTFCRRAKNDLRIYDFVARFVCYSCAGEKDLAPRGPAASARRARADESPSDYQIYPSVHEMTYGDSWILRPSANVLVEDGIDADTRARLDEALALKDIDATPVTEVPAGGYATYEAAYRALCDALLDADNLPEAEAEAEGERLAAELEASKAELVPDRTAQDRAQLALNDAGQYAERNYGPKSWGVFAAARDELAAALQTGADAPTYERLTESLEEAIAGLRAPDDPSEVVTPGGGEDPGTGEGEAEVPSEGEAPGTSDGVENPGTAKPTDGQRPSTPKSGAASKPSDTVPSSAAQSPSVQKAVTSGTASLPQTGDVAMTGIVPIALIGVALATLGILALRKGFQRR